LIKCGTAPIAVITFATTAVAKEKDGRATIGGTRSAR
jgi:hypothetical protein